ncbi:MAG: hypothetical protein P1V97_16445 [Planctomycetota bacterium]|nr:hypothetical protein [Planctomycetota bacterium]
MNARCKFLRAFLIPLLTLILGCQTNGPDTKPDLSAAPTITKIRTVPPAVGTRTQYLWGDLLAGSTSFDQAPKKWQRGDPLTIKVRAFHIPAMNQVPRNWGSPSETALILSETLLLAPKQMTFLFGEKQPAPKLLLTNKGAQTLQARATLSADLRVHGALKFKEALQDLQDVNKSIELLSESMLVAEDLGSYAELFVGRVEEVFDSQSKLKPRSSKRLAQLGFTRNSSLYPPGLIMSIKVQAPSFQGQPLDEEILLNPFPVPKDGLTIALILKSPITVAGATLPSALVFLIRVERSSWIKQSFNALIAEGDLARQRVLSIGILQALRQRQDKRGIDYYTARLFRELALELELTTTLKPPPSSEEWRAALRNWSLQDKKSFGQTGLDFLERIFGNAWHPSAGNLSSERLNTEELRAQRSIDWLKEALKEVDELADGEVFEELVILNRKALDGKLNERWRAMEWFRCFFPEIPQRSIPFALQPSPAFLVVLDSVLASHGLETRRRG